MRGRCGESSDTETPPPPSPTPTLGVLDSPDSRTFVSTTRGLPLRTPHPTPAPAPQSHGAGPMGPPTPHTWVPGGGEGAHVGQQRLPELWALVKDSPSCWAGAGGDDHRALGLGALTA